MYQKFIIILSFLLYFNCISQLQPETNLQNLADNWEIYIGPQSDHLLINQYTKENTELWKPVPIPSNLNDFIKWNPSNGEILLRKRFDFRNVADTSFSISLGKISDQVRVYWNGQELSEELFSDYKNSIPQGYDRTRIYSISENKIFQKNEILIFIRPYFDYEYGILSGQLEIGPSTTIWKRFYLREIGGLLIFGSFLLIGGFFLFLSWREKKYGENFYFGFFLILFSLFQASLSDLKYFTGFKIIYLKKVEYSFLVFLFPLFCRFLNSLFGKVKGRFQIFLEITVLFLFFWILCAESVFDLDAINRYALQISWIGFVYLSLRILIPNLKKSFESRTIFLGILFLLICVGIDVFSQRGMLKMIRLSGLGVSGFLGFLTLILANKFVKMKEKLKSWNSVLETAIRERTKELSSSLEEVKNLKEQQDGDYFLITLLFQPFLSKNLETNYAQIDIHRKQYKNFQFKNRSYEIGGDVVLRESAFISGVEYQVLINADAMGKSLQGASGALIFCSIVKSFLQTQDYEFRNPENWLFLLYSNLQAVFESFDGSMLVSGILSLYQISTGDLFFINCEHPPIVLSRNGKTSYLKETAVLRKIGFPDSDSKIKIEYYKLLPGDTILYGSDGREDLYIQDPFHSSRKQKSSVPDLFFKLIQNSIPKLEDLEFKIQEKGTLSDDLSFLRIQIGPETVFKKNFSESEVLIRKGNEFLQSGNFQKACFQYARASILNPGDLKLSRSVLVLAKKSGNLKLIRFFSEKILLRTDGIQIGKDFLHKTTSLRLKSADNNNLIYNLIKK
ncbi:SpoIIE family protein phosphatase [Leptospira kirschneri]|uniref:Stage II sporulation protein E n=1 Tax=Leptospira kirschneri str. 200802841 TaxID=1193047 RepID=A0A828Y404_9LEPT|nr:SpoIIE family protein phosphatase [Leptospira kirschneri]EJO70651.1 stage II sporulation protein E [Leptospira kirschneri serovar Grippotyphosa str. RM52]EKO51046.1 stage II sporulation protein E [Leptospira kirschneri str. 200802841]EKQ82025.1 stage II sporulation protein E [Leptospira kirschneri serovar Grippotyphosa str. Moskva]EKR09794.1 stage II sporulation protein E [Leptospira kirschneri serovar Valbuzzi str. 200702274]EMK01149.1 stage II sporulation protein E [Leptospira kirschneri 